LNIGQTNKQVYVLLFFRLRALKLGAGTVDVQTRRRLMREEEISAQPIALYEPRPGMPEAASKALDSAFLAFAREAGVQISAYLRSAVASRYAGAEEQCFSDFLAARAPYSSAAVLDAEALNCRILFDFEPALFFALLELMLGGKPAARMSISRSPTEIEKQLVAVLIRCLAAELERAWAEVAPHIKDVKLVFAGIEADSRLPALFAPSTALLAARFEITVGDKAGALTIVTPLQTANTEFRPAAAAAEPAPEMPEGERLHHLVMDASVRIDAWLEDVTMPFRDLVQLREGHVIKFDYALERALTCTVNGAAGFQGQIVSTGRRRAFLVEGQTPQAAWRPAGGS
jgi:flagellar motor switch protein FliM